MSARTQAEQDIATSLDLMAETAEEHDHTTMAKAIVRLMIVTGWTPPG